MPLSEESRLLSNTSKWKYKRGLYWFFILQQFDLFFFYVGVVVYTKNSTIARPQSRVIYLLPPNENLVTSYTRNDVTRPIFFHLSYGISSPYNYIIYKIRSSSYRQWQLWLK